MDVSRIIEMSLGFKIKMNELFDGYGQNMHSLILSNDPQLKILHL